MRKTANWQFALVRSALAKVICIDYEVTTKPVRISTTYGELMIAVRVNENHGEVATNH